MSEFVSASYAMPFCATCAHWRPPQTEECVYMAETKHGRCAAALHDVEGAINYTDEDFEAAFEWRGAEKLAEARVLHAHPMVVMDGSGYKAALFTLPSHFCALHTFKQEPK